MSNVPTPAEAIDESCRYQVRIWWLCRKEPCLADYVDRHRELARRMLRLRRMVRTRA